MSSKRITINQILSNESLVQENQYFQVSAGWALWEGRGCACHSLGAALGDGGPPA